MVYLVFFSLFTDVLGKLEDAVGFNVAWERRTFGSTDLVNMERLFVTGFLQTPPQLYKEKESFHSRTVYNISSTISPQNKLQ